METEIYIDRFVYDNRSYLCKIQGNLEELNFKKQDLEEILKHYENYSQTNKAAPEIVEMAIKLLYECEENN